MLTNPGLWSVNLEHGEHWWYAHVAELPGCFTRSETKEEAIKNLQSIIDDHLKWLANRGFVFPSRSDFMIVEEVGNIPMLGESGGAVALFESDLRVVDEASFRFFRDLMRLNREDLMFLVSNLNPLELEMRPFPEKRTVNEDLRHIANAEEWYISRLGLYYQRIYEGYLKSRKNKKKERLEQIQRNILVRNSVSKTLETAFTTGVHGKFKRRAYTKFPDELWTFRKVLRRFVEHEKEHIGTIKRVVDAF